MEHTRVILACCDQKQYEVLENRRKCGDRILECGTEVVMGSLLLTEDGGALDVVETAPFTHGVIGDATVVVVARGCAPASGPIQAETDEEGKPSVDTDCDTETLFLPSSFVRPCTQSPVWVAATFEPDVWKSLVASRLIDDDVPEQQDARDTQFTAVVSLSDAIRLNVKEGSLLQLQPSHRQASPSSSSSSSSDADNADEAPPVLYTVRAHIALDRLFTATFPPRDAEQPPVLALAPDMYCNAFREVFPFFGADDVPESDDEPFTASLRPAAIVGVAAEGSVPAARWVEFAPVAEASFAQVPPAVVDAMILDHFSTDPNPSQLLHIGDLITLPAPSMATLHKHLTPTELLSLDLSAVLDPYTQPPWQNPWHHRSKPPQPRATFAVSLIVRRAADTDGLVPESAFRVDPKATALHATTAPRCAPAVPVLLRAAKRARRVAARWGARVDFRRGHPPQDSDPHDAGLLPGPQDVCWELARTRELVAKLVTGFTVGRQREEGYQGSVWIEGGERNGVAEAVRVAASVCGARLLEVCCHGLGKAELQSLATTVQRSRPVVVHLRRAEFLGAVDAGDLAQFFESDIKNTNVAFVASCDVAAPPPSDAESPAGEPASQVLDGVPSLFQDRLKFDPPSPSEREGMFRCLLPYLARSNAVTPARLSKATAGLSFLAVLQVVASAVQLAAERAVLHCTPEQFAQIDCTARVPLTMADVSQAVSEYNAMHGISVATNVQKVAWKDIGGLHDAKREIMECIHLPMTQPQLFSGSGLKPRTGILMFGPPGCGKTLLAKGVATECGLNFMSVKGPEMLNMYVGESERNIRDLFKRAKEAAPCVVFFDELDALVPNRGANGDSGGVMDRIVAQLLSELDSLTGDPSEFVFIIGATNRPDLIDQSLLRPGRFDRCVYLGVSTSDAEQATVLKAQTRKMNLAPDVDFISLVADMPKTYSGADMYALSTEALMLAMRERIDDLVATVKKRRELEEREEQAAQAPPGNGDAAAGDAEGEGQSEGTNFSSIVVHQAHFVAAKQTTLPSITPKDLRRYLAMKEQFAAKQQPV
ncbi:Peroxisomal biogenesis factor 6 [Diplonema papillatum]|nr:Peroxisomal biogenesis factor 6 [Diplonema papillatum]|eukprot:gene19178-29526_t